MKELVKNFILKEMSALAFGNIELIQSLWSGYGEILRCELLGSKVSSVVVKLIKPSQNSDHPRGWNTDMSHNRKVKSYEVEEAWYKEWAKKCNSKCRVPQCFAIDTCDDEVVVILEDLNSSGFPARKSYVSSFEVKSCLGWLAEFHSIFMGIKPKSLWEQGTYWHLDTRPDELKMIDDKRLKEVAPDIDKKLATCKYQTFVHGDAKLANFCFSPDGRYVAAVDFQYVGGGCGMKDVVYFISSCLDEYESEMYEKDLLDYYFDKLKLAIETNQPGIDSNDVVREWRDLYSVAWADFYRFLEGWSPSHWKVNSYSRRLTYEVIDRIEAEKNI